MDHSVTPGARILILDDDPAIIQYLTTLLETEEYKVVPATTLAEARALLPKGAFDLVLADKNLPDGSGLELCRELAENPADCEILMMTGYASLESAVEAMRYGVSDYLETPFERDDLMARLTRALKTLALKRHNAELVGELRQSNAMLEKLAIVDPLTQLYNHAYFHDSLDREVRRASRQDRSFSVVLLDLDGFKAINDSFGHKTGDEVLHRFAESLRGRNRRLTDLAFRLRENDVAARYGGDEFAVILPDTPKIGAAVLAERLRVQFETLGLHDSQPVQLTLSLGIAGFPDDAADRDGIIEAADMALHAAKAGGKNRVVSYSPGLSRSSSSRSRTIGKQAAQLEALSDSLERRAFRFAYQPIVDVGDWHVHAYEALCRPTDERFRSPADLFRAAEDAGQILPLGRVLRELCIVPVGEMPAPCRMFINIHPHELNDPRLLDGETILREHAQRIVFEITEAAEIENFGRTRDLLAKLRAHGYRIALDDLGAGYASLNLLALLEPDYVKLDIEMVRAIRGNDRTGRLVSHILDFARGENMQVVAEGIETTDEYQSVRSLGVTLMQGYYFARPSPP
ncbi:MAG: putative bifunctional diguanylate cyclase/phosphodiesterase, partial [Polyangia bacterium]